MIFSRKNKNGVFASRARHRSCFSSVAFAVGLTLSAGIAPVVAASFNIMEAGVDDVHAAFKSGKLTSRQLVQMYLDRIEAFDRGGPQINSVITLNAQALADADKLDAAYKKSGPVGPLHGIPILIKDQIDTAGMPTTLGSVLFKDYMPPLDAVAVDKLRKAGAIILGKTTLGEFGGGDSYGSLFGVTRNPYDLERTVGGSSGGSAAALSANFCTLALGEEGYASIRRPSTWNAVVGMRPTPGLVSRSGMSAGYPSPVGQVGPMARTVRDMAVLLDAIVGYDPEDPSTAFGVGQIPKSYTAFLDKNGLKGARIGVIRESFGGRSEPGTEDYKKVEVAFQKAVAELKAAGAIVVDPIVIPDLNALLAKRASGPASDEEVLKVWLARNPNSPYKNRADVSASPLVDKIIPAPKAVQWKNAREKNDPAKYVAYVEARERLMDNVMKVMADNQLDAIVHSAVEHQPSLIKDGINPPYVSSKGVPHINTFLIHVASMTVPAGFTSDNLPIGITFFGRAFSEPALLKYAYAYEQATKHRIPPKTTPALAVK